MALGGDLSPARLLAAYRRGIFPWYSEGQPILWWSPDPRAVFSPAGIHQSRSLKKHLRQCGWQVTINNQFKRVIQACSEPRTYADGTWLSADMKDAYEQLHYLGYAHSIEVWQGSELMGGLYGLALGRVFFGESMFSVYANGSKVALQALAWLASELGIELIDCQVGSAHVYSMGAENLPRIQFERRLAQLATPVLTQQMHPAWASLRLRQIPCDQLIQP